MTRLDDEEQIARLRLIRSERIGPVLYRRLIAAYGDGRRALEAVPELARRGGGRPIHLCQRSLAEDEIAGLARLGAALIECAEPGFPPLLAQVADAPPLIAVRGRAGLLDRPAVAIVGARNASAAGRRMAAMIAADLGVAGYVVVSGLARGIDAAAHEAALAAGTVAVVAGGLDVVYPQENARLHERIVHEGVVVAEQPLGMQPQATHFPRRNRIISGLAQGVVVVEAALGSGSLITARLAAEQGREVFAVPGSPLDPRARGANGLLRDGAVLTESAEDVIVGLRGWRPRAREPEALGEPLFGSEGESTGLERVRALVLEVVGPTPVEVDEILRQCQITPAVARIVLLELELAGRIERHPGNRVALSFTTR
ncbi:MAG: DNA-protecting protein DprA [Alphaproteobacteria bacterium]|nr:DNA-protecting protein DprA [Alphaproteobacteria bacterium]